jgi:ABC-type branched-subunit amino acid transport system substrate-binding protein
LGLVAVLALIGAGCASSAKKSSTAVAPTPTAASGGGDIVSVVRSDPLAGPKGSGLTRGVTATTIKVGCVLQTASFAGADDGYKARFERANREGGIAGRKIEFTACRDDGSNTQQNLQIARGLVEQDKDFAVMSISANMLPSTTDYLGQNQVPYFGWGFEPGFCGTRWGFGFNGCLIGDSLPNLPHAVVQGNLFDAIVQAANFKPADVRGAFQAGDDDSGHAGNKQYNTLYQARGAKVVYNQANIPVPGPPADYTPFVRAVLAANPNVVITSTNFQSAPGFVASLAGAGYTGVNVNFVAYIPGLLSSSAQLASALQGAYINSQIVPQEEQTPYIKQIEQDLLAVNAKNGKFILFGAANAYAQAEMLVEQLQAVGKDLNTKTFDDKINGGSFKFSPPEAGGPGKLGFPEGHFLPSDCAAIVKVQSAQFVPVVPFKCYASLRVR